MSISPSEYLIFLSDLPQALPKQAKTAQKSPSSKHGRALRHLSVFTAESFVSKLVHGSPKTGHRD
jgi:hypothetical protein